MQTPDDTYYQEVEAGVNSCICEAAPTDYNSPTAVLEAALARKKEEELSNLSIEDLQKRIKALQEASITQ